MLYTEGKHKFPRRVDAVIAEKGDQQHFKVYSFESNVFQVPVDVMVSHPNTLVQYIFNYWMSYLVFWHTTSFLGVYTIVLWIRDS